MSKKSTSATSKKMPALPTGYGAVCDSIVELLNAARQTAARNVNALMTASYWEIGRRIVEAEQKGKRRAGYGEQLIERLSKDLTERFGRGFSRQNLQQMRQFYMLWAIPQTVSAESQIRQTVSGELKSAESTPISQTLSRKLSLTDLAQAFALPWSAYLRLLSVKDDHARAFYEVETLRGGWSVRQLDRQIGSQYYERTALSKNKAAMLTKGAIAKPEDKGAEVIAATRHEHDYILRTDMVGNFDGGSALIEQRLKNKDTVLILGVWEQLNNAGFNSPKFEGIKKEAWRNSFYLPVKKWVDAADAIGLQAKASRNGRYTGAAGGFVESGKYKWGADRSKLGCAADRVHT